MSPSHAAAKEGTRTELLIVQANTIPPRPVRWLWPGRIPLGKSGLIAGNPGLGKSQLTCALAATVSTGGTWPDGTRAPLGDVLLVTDEDDFNDTVVPRLIAADADLSRVGLLEYVLDGPEDAPRERGFDLGVDLKALTLRLELKPAIRLVIIDPLTAYLGQPGENNNSHRTSDMRWLLRPLERMAQDRGVTVLLVTHLNKSGSTEALTRVTGSYAFVAQARTAYLVVQHPDNAERRLLLTVKNNVAKHAPGLAYEIAQSRLDSPEGPIETSHVVWVDEPVTITADEALHRQATAGSTRHSERVAAAEWVQQALADGPVAKRLLERQAARDGLPWRTVHRGAKVLGVRMTREGFGAGSIWSLDPSFAPPDAQSCQPSDVARLGTTGTNGEPAALPWEPPDGEGEGESGDEDRDPYDPYADLDDEEDDD